MVVPHERRATPRTARKGASRLGLTRASCPRPCGPPPAASSKIAPGDFVAKLARRLCGRGFSPDWVAMPFAAKAAPTRARRAGAASGVETRLMASLETASRIFLMPDTSLPRQVALFLYKSSPGQSVINFGVS